MSENATSLSSTNRSTLQPLSLRRNFSWAFLGNVVYAGCQWGVLVALARQGNPEMVGLYVLGLAICTPLFMFTSLELRLIQATDMQGTYRFGDYLSLRLLGVVVAGVSGVVVGAVSGYRDATLAVIGLIALAKALEWVSDGIYGLFQRNERLDRSGTAMVIHGVCNLMAICIVLKHTGSLIWALIAYCTAQLAGMIAYDFPSALMLLRQDPVEGAGGRVRTELVRIRGFVPFGNLPRLRSLFWLGLPLAATSLFVSLTSSIPRYLVAHYGNIVQLGVFGAIASLMVSGAMLARALNSSTSPRLAQYYASGNVRAFKTLFLKAACLYVVLGFAGVCAAVAWGDVILRVVFQPEYAQYANVLTLVMIALALAYPAGLIHTALIAVRQIRVLLPLTLLTCIWTLAISCVLVPRFGIAGAAIALGLARVPYILIGVAVLAQFARRQDQQQHSDRTEVGIGERPTSIPAIRRVA